MAIVGSAVLISIPPLNAIIHGTYAVTGHAMGATIGIDTMILLGAVIWIVGEYLRAREGETASDPLHRARMRWSVVGLNVGVALLRGVAPRGGRGHRHHPHAPRPGGGLPPAGLARGFVGDRVRTHRGNRIPVLQFGPHNAVSSRVPVLPGSGLDLTALTCSN